MVCGLVQYQQIRPGHHDQAQLQPRAFAAGELAHGLELILAPEAERAQPVAGLLGLAAALIQHCIIQRALGMFKHNHLRQIRRAHRRPEPERARVGRLLAQNNLEKSGLPRAVGAQQRHPFAAPDLPGHVFKKRTAIVALGQPLNGQHTVG